MDNNRLAYAQELEKDYQESKVSWSKEKWISNLITDDYSHADVMHLVAERDALFDKTGQFAKTTIYYNTVDRGYRLGWTAEQFLARQAIKLQEELGELASQLHLPQCFDGNIQILGETSRRLFDNREAWSTAGLPPFRRLERIQKIKEELADLQVVLFNAASMIEEMTDEEFDLIDAAVKKSEADIARGVR